MSSQVGIDPRAWLCWAGAALLVPLMGRNPFALASVLLAVLAVREALPPEARAGWSWVIRLGLVFGAISVLFNLLTVRAGNRVIVSIPESVPVLGGDLTVNSVVFGLLGGLAVLTLVLIGITLSAVLDWSAMLRLLPQSLTGAGVAGSVAFSFFPQMVATYREVVDAQAVRGEELRGPRDYLGLAPLLLSGGIERAVTMSELLESRGFGGAPPRRRSAWIKLCPASGLAAICVAVYGFAAGELVQALVAGAAGMGLLVVTVLASRGSDVRRTRYRSLVWQRTDWIVLLGALLAVGTVILTGRDALRYEPYPVLVWPDASLPLTIGLLGLLGPVVAILWRERAR
ncbi:MAG: energy-coupling factor transporter transmembrane protein EcfT [Thermomicrobiales bacterium]|nr:energy-coupling factor transporter transmembrane protein EcfT [Thermomicrobiales bacterium]